MMTADGAQTLPARTHARALAGVARALGKLRWFQRADCKYRKAITDNKNREDGSQKRTAMARFTCRV